MNIPKFQIVEQNKTFFLDYLAENQDGEKGECWKNICSGTYDHCLNEKVKLININFCNGLLIFN